MVVLNDTKAMSFVIGTMARLVLSTPGVAASVSDTRRRNAWSDATGPVHDRLEGGVVPDAELRADQVVSDTGRRALRVTALVAVAESHARRTGSLERS